MQAHIKTARVHGAISWLYLVIGLLACTFPYMLYQHNANGNLLEIVPALIFPGLFLLLFTVHRVIANGARQRKEWARIATIVIGIISLMGFPVGTMIGVYLLINSSWPAENELGSLA
jgi:hypothetical protein